MLQNNQLRFVIKLLLFNKKISENFRECFIMILVLCRIRHTPAAPQPPLSRGVLPGSSVINRPFGKSPLERGASSVVKMEEAGCVKIRITGLVAEIPQKNFFL